MGISTERKSATVKIVNNSSHNIISAGVVHKYSDVYSDSHIFTDIKQGQASSDEMHVSFNIGFFTTGRDWWQVTWVTDDGKAHLTTPNNFRDIIDRLETVSTKIVGPLATIGAAAAAIASGGTATPVAIAAATLVTTVVANVLSNSESTAGFKQHILREDDTGENKIVIYDDRVEFKSHSGDSSTVLTTIHAKKNKDGEYEVIKS